MLASLCWRPSRADSSFQQRAQRTPRTRLAAIASPLPEPPSTIAALDLARRHRLGDRADERRIVDRHLGFVPKSFTSWPSLARNFLISSL